MADRRARRDEEAPAEAAPADDKILPLRERPADTARARQPAATPAPTATAEPAAAAPARKSGGAGCCSPSAPSSRSIVGLFLYLSGGRYVTTDNAYVQADKLNVATDVSGIVAEIAVRENQRVKTAPCSSASTTSRSASRSPAPRRSSAPCATRSRRCRRPIARPSRRSSRRRPTSSSTDDHSSASRAVEARRRRAGRRRPGEARPRRRAGARAGRRAPGRGRARPARRQRRLAPSRIIRAIARRRPTSTRRSATSTARRSPRRCPASWRTSMRCRSASICRPVRRRSASSPPTTSGSTPIRRRPISPSLQPGNTAEVAVDAYPGREWPASVESISPATGAEFSVLPGAERLGQLGEGGAARAGAAEGRGAGGRAAAALGHERRGRRSTPGTSARCTISSRRSRHWVGALSDGRRRRAPPRRAHGLRDAGDDHAGARHHHRQRRPALHAGLALGDPGPDQLGADVLHRRRRDHDAGDRACSPRASAASGCSSSPSPASPAPRCCAASRSPSSRWCCSACCRASSARRSCRCRSPSCSTAIRARSTARRWRCGASA